MTYSDFINKIKAAKIDINECSYILDISEKFFINGDRKKSQTDFICQSWEVGGISGGSYHEESNPQPYHTTHNQPTTFNELDAILELICPSISFLRYNHIESMIEYGEATDYEYYGNRTDYEYRWIDLKKLYAYIIEIQDKI